MPNAHAGNSQLKLSSDCRLVEDTAWHPVMKTEIEKWGPVQSTLYKTFLGSPLKLWASVGHWWIWHFDLNKYTEKQKPRVSWQAQQWLRVYVR